MGAIYIDPVLKRATIGRDECVVMVVAPPASDGWERRKAGARPALWTNAPGGAAGPPLLLGAATSLLDHDDLPPPIVATRRADVMNDMRVAAERC